MGGELDVVTAPGEGSTFSFTVPLERVTAPSQPRAIALPAALRVLAVDDNAINRAIIKAHLSDAGATVATAPSAQRALDALREPAEPFDVVLVDGDMPGVNSIELAQQIATDVRTIVVTSNPDQRSAARAAGLHHHLQKPVRRARLLDAITRALSDAADERAEHVRRPAQRETLLVVEDNPVNQRVACAMLTNLGFAVELAANGREALEALQQRDYPLVLMDCQMPELDGYETTAAIRAGAAGRADVPIVAMTAHALHGDRERCLAAGMDDYVAKPLRADVLDAVVSRCLGRAATPEPPAAVEPGDALLDEARLERMRSEYGDMLGEFVSIFLSSTPPLLEELKRAASAADADAGKRAAHSLKGSCRTMGADFMATLAADLEQSPATDPAELTRLEDAFARTGEVLQAQVTPAG